jgi:hypothetical protein
MQQSTCMLDAACMRHLVACAELPRHMHNSLYAVQIGRRSLFYSLVKTQTADAAGPVGHAA